jgi:hypothetical protein
MLHTYKKINYKKKSFIREFFRELNYNFRLCYFYTQFLELKYYSLSKFQKKFKNYSDDEVWNLDTHLASIFLKHIKNVDIQKGLYHITQQDWYAYEAEIEASLALLKIELCVRTLKNKYLRLYCQKYLLLFKQEKIGAPRISKELIEYYDKDQFKTWDLMISDMIQSLDNPKINDKGYNLFFEYFGSLWI